MGTRVALRNLVPRLVRAMLEQANMENKSRGNRTAELQFPPGRRVRLNFVIRAGVTATSIVFEGSENGTKSTSCLVTTVFIAVSRAQI